MSCIHTRASFKKQLFFWLSLITSLGYAYSPYAEAISAYSLRTVELLVDQGTDMEMRNSDGLTALQQAIYQNEVAIVEHLLAHQANIHAPLVGIAEGTPAMRLAVKHADMQVVTWLADKEVALDGAFKELMFANRPSDQAAQVAKMLLDVGAYIDEVFLGFDRLNARSVLHYVPCLRDMRDAPFNGGTPECADPLTNLLLQAFNAPHTLNLKQPTSLAFAAQYGGPRLVKAVIEAGGDVNERLLRTPGNEVYEAQEMVPLELALYTMNYGAIQMLLAYGADPEAVSSQVWVRALRDGKVREIAEYFDVDLTPYTPPPNGFTRVGAARDPWQGERCAQAPHTRAQVTFVLDDGESTDLGIIPIFTSRGYVGTLGIVSNLVGLPGRLKADELQVLQSLGWEVASHTADHLDLSELSPIEIDEQLSNSKEALEDYGLHITSIVYPFGSVNREVQRHVPKYYQAGLIGGYEYNYRSSDPFRLARFNITNRNDFGYYKRVTDRAIRDGGWLIWALHSGYDLNIDQEDNVAQLLDYICSQGVRVVTVAQGMSLYRMQERAYRE